MELGFGVWGLGLKVYVAFRAFRGLSVDLCMSPFVTSSLRANGLFAVPQSNKLPRL